jgi:hypothetical protein
LPARDQVTRAAAEQHKPSDTCEESESAAGASIQGDPGQSWGADFLAAGCPPALMVSFHLKPVELYRFVRIRNSCL